MLRLRWTILVHTLNHFHSQFNRELSQQSYRGLAARVIFHELTQQGENWMMHSVWRENLQAEAKKEQKTMRTNERDRVNGTLCVWRKLVVNYMHAPSWNAGYLIILLWGKTVEKIDGGTTKKETKWTNERENKSKSNRKHDSKQDSAQVSCTMHSAHTQTQWNHSA